MKPGILLVLIGCALIGAISAQLASAEEFGRILPQNRVVVRSYRLPWHNAFYDPANGAPMALVVPPTAEFQSQYGWGVPSMRVTPIYHQFSPAYPGAGVVYSGGAGFMPTPYWPSDTTQMGVYYVRGPWGTW